MMKFTVLIKATLVALFFSASISYAKTNVVEVGYNAYPPTVTLWLTHLKNAKVFGKTYIGPIEGNGTIDRRHKNGRRDTIIFVPEQYNKEKPTDLLIWLHGHNGFNKFETRILRHLNSLYSRGKNPVVVAVEQPWSHWTYTRTSRNGTGPFRKPGEFEKWIDSTLKILKRYEVPVESISSDKIILYGHSAGGSGIMSMAKSGALQILKPGTIVFSDSTYGMWFDVVYDKYVLEHPATQVYILTQKHGRPWKQMKRFMYVHRKKGIAKNVHHIALDSRKWTHKRIGDNCLLYPGKPFN